MIKNQITLAAALVVSSVCIFIGCMVENPNKAPNPATGETPSPYIVDPKLNTISNTVTGVVTAISPVNPWAGITDFALKAGFTVAGVVSGWLVQKRNTAAAQAQAAQKQNLLTTVIQGVEDAGTAAAQVKTAIQTRATAAGVQPQLDAVVKSVT